MHYECHEVCLFIIIFRQIAIMRWKSLEFHLFCKNLWVFLVTATTLLLLLFLQLGLPEAAWEQHDYRLGPQLGVLALCLKIVLIVLYHPFSPFWSPWGEGVCPHPTPLWQASQAAAGKVQHLHLSSHLLHLLLLLPISGRATPQLSLLPHSCHQEPRPMRALGPQPSNGRQRPLYHASC